MTEEEWLTCTDSWRMIRFVEDIASERQLRLFAAACCRRVWRLLADERSRRAVKVAERVAEGLAKRKALRAAAAAARKACEDIHLLGHRAEYAAQAAQELARDNFALTAYRAALAASPDGTARDERELARQADLARDVFGPCPRRPAAIPPAWLTWGGGTVVRLARAAYDNRRLPSGRLDNARLAVLADALEEAGCTDAAILDHCRGAGDHVRGCWLVEALLARG